MPKIIFLENASNHDAVLELEKSLKSKGSRVKVYFERDADNPINFYRTAYFTKNTYRHIILNFTIYSGELVENTVLLDDIRLVRYEENGRELFVNPILGVLKGRSFPEFAEELSEYVNVYKLAFEEFASGDFSDFDYIIFENSFKNCRLMELTETYNLSKDEAMCHIKAFEKILDCFDIDYIEMPLS